MSTQPQPVAYYCDHRHLDPDKHPHYLLECVIGEGWRIVKRPEVAHDLNFTYQDYKPAHLPAELRDFQCPSAQPLYLPHSRLVEAARRALDALDDLIADSRDPGTEALGARYELAQALTNHPAAQEA
ncbi:hypothetical protein AB0D10_05500 [Kitasatospora sp. NPDC048545]|uniref:hypothetical protein n=1 Tax=Kitasatospora sp. NPDC048545 TaxID=3157208 RepID=UPI003403D21F